MLNVCPGEGQIYKMEIKTVTGEEVVRVGYGFWWGGSLYQYESLEKAKGARDIRFRLASLDGKPY